MRSLAQHYEDEEGEEIRPIGDDPQFFLINFKDIANFRDLISSISINNLLIDNDYGLIEPISSFVIRWQQNPEWDWIKQQYFVAAENISQTAITVCNCGASLLNAPIAAVPCKVGFRLLSSATRSLT